MWRYESTDCRGVYWLFGPNGNEASISFIADPPFPELFMQAVVDTLNAHELNASGVVR